MFKIGDHILYPMHGAGVIKAIEEKEIQGEKREYYIIKLPFDEMRVMIPVEKMKSLNIRLVADLPTLNQVLQTFQHGKSDKSLSFRERSRNNSEKMKTGKIQDVAEVVRDLMRMNKEKTLNSTEKQMLRNAEKIFISELKLIKGISRDEATEFLHNAV